MSTLKYNAIVRNKYIRQDLETGKFGIGYLLFMGKLHRAPSVPSACVEHLNEIKRLNRIIDKLINIKNKLNFKNWFKRR